jgi:hypothetical protein
MARKNRSLTTFDEVSSNELNDTNNGNINNTEKETVNNINNNIKNKTEKEIENNILNNGENGIKKETVKNNVNNTNNDSLNNSKLDDLLSGKKEKKNVPTMIHLEPEVTKVLDKISGVKKGRSGKKSQIVNEVLKEFFRSRGLMD